MSEWRESREGGREGGRGRDGGKKGGRDYHSIYTLDGYPQYKDQQENYEMKHNNWYEY